MNLAWNPRALERSLIDRFKKLAAARAEHLTDAEVRSRTRDEWMQRLRRELAYRRFLARLFTSQPEEWVVKGGVALQFRLQPNRASNDIDIAHLHHGTDHVIALRRLRLAAATDLGDLFRFELGQPRTIEDEDRAISLLVVTSLGVKEFTRFEIDLAPPRTDIEFDEIVPDATTVGIDILDAMPPLRLISINQQVADKVCAIFELHGAEGRPSERSRDLGDIAMLAAQCEFVGSQLTEAIRREASRRRSGLLGHGLPATIRLADEQMRTWASTWDKSARNPQFSFADSLSIVAGFLDLVLQGRVLGLNWRPGQGWTTP